MVDCFFLLNVYNKPINAATFPTPFILTWGLTYYRHAKTGPFSQQTLDFFVLKYWIPAKPKTWRRSGAKCCILWRWYFMTPVDYTLCSFCRLYWNVNSKHFPWFQAVLSSDLETRAVLLVNLGNSVISQIFLILSEKNEISSCLSSSCFSYFPILWSLFMKLVSVISVSSYFSWHSKKKGWAKWGWLQSPESNHLSLHWSARNITWNQCNTAQNTVYWEVKRKKKKDSRCFELLICL